MKALILWGGWDGHEPGPVADLLEGELQAKGIEALKVNSDNPPVGERMPFLAAPLDADEIAVIRNWINQGALDN